MRVHASGRWTLVPPASRRRASFSSSGSIRLRGAATSPGRAGSGTRPADRRRRPLTGSRRDAHRGRWPGAGSPSRQTIFSRTSSSVCLAGRSWNEGAGRRRGRSGQPRPPAAVGRPHRLLSDAHDLPLPVPRAKPGEGSPEQALRAPRSDGMPPRTRRPSSRPADDLPVRGSSSRQAGPVTPSRPYRLSCAADGGRTRKRVEDEHTESSPGDRSLVRNGKGLCRAALR